MARILQYEVEKLKKMILSLGGIVEEMLNQSVMALETADKQLAIDVINRDAEVDRMEIDVEEECLKILALHQPVAIDLRFLVVVLKINNDLERIGDLASNIAESAANLTHKTAITPPFDLRGMCDKVRLILKESLDCLVNLDVRNAYQVCELEDEIDVITHDNLLTIKQSIQQTPSLTDALLDYFSVNRYLERIGDHAKKIAEDVIYLVEGVIVRHQKVGKHTIDK